MTRTLVSYKIWGYIEAEYSDGEFEDRGGWPLLLAEGLTRDQANAFATNLDPENAPYLDETDPDIGDEVDDDESE